MRQVILALVLQASWISSVLATEEQDIMVITATQTAQSIQDVDASIEVITRDQINKFSGRSLGEVLKHSAGLYIIDIGSSTRISMRGLEHKHSLVLVDGLRRTEKYAEGNVNNISLENIERIEIVRGPMSALYGSDALGGVINIITRSTEKNSTRIKFSAGSTTEGGGRESGLVHLSQDIKLDTSAHSIGLELKNRNAYIDENGLLNAEERAFLNYRGQFKLTNDQALRIGYEYVKQDDTNARPETGEFERDERHTIFGQYTKKFGTDQLNVDLSYGQSDSLTQRGSGNESTDFKQTQLDARYSGRFGKKHLYSIGAGYRHDDAEISINSRDAKRDIFHIYAQDQWELSDQVRLTSGLRYDRYSDFGSTVNPRFSLSWRESDWNIRAGYGQAFAAPTFTEMHAYFTRRGGTLVVQGNSNLQPEEAETFELSLRKDFNDGYFDITAYRSDVDQLIDYSTERVVGTCPNCTIFLRANNISQAVLKGLETNLNYSLSDHHHLNLAIEYLDARDTISNKRLTSRPRLQARFTLDSEWNNQWSTSIRGHYQDDFYKSDDGSTTAYNSNLMTFDLSTKYRLRSNLELFSGINNVFNTEAPTNMSFRFLPQDPGARYIYAGISLTY